jgi:hypothetical protein
LHSVKRKQVSALIDAVQSSTFSGESGVINMKNRKAKKNMRHIQAVARIAEIHLWRRIRLLDSRVARKTLTFVE